VLAQRTLLTIALLFLLASLIDTRKQFDGGTVKEIQQKSQGVIDELNTIKKQISEAEATQSNQDQMT
jgi:hypothetical protein